MFDENCNLRYLTYLIIGLWTITLLYSRLESTDGDSYKLNDMQIDVGPTNFACMN